MGFYLQEPYQATAQDTAKNRIWGFGKILVGMLGESLRNPLNRSGRFGLQLRKPCRVSLFGYPEIP
jgi:hypothetical protein